MASNLPSIPAIPCAFAANGNKNTIPDTYIGSGGTASFNAGFPPETSEPISGGGIPPSRLDMNGALNVATFPQYFLQMGGYYTFDSNVAGKIGGYPLGAILTYFDSANKVVRKVRSKKANNSDNFLANSSYIGVSWEDVTPTIQTGIPLFATFWALTTASPYGAVPLDGQWLTQNDYPDFYSEAVAESIAKHIPTTTSTAYEQSISNSGQCGRFVIDTANHRIRIPTVKPHSFIENATSGATMDSSTVGIIHNAGLPNITGSIQYKGGFKEVGAFESGANVSGAFSKTSQANGGVVDFHDGGSVPWVRNIEFDASDANAIYGRANTVQPQSMEMRLFMQVKKAEYIAGGTTSGAITSAQANIIASSATNDILSNGGYATSGGVSQMISSAIGSGGGVFDGGTVHSATVFNSTVTISKLLTASGGIVVNADSSGWNYFFDQVPASSGGVVGFGFSNGLGWHGSYTVGTSGFNIAFGNDYGNAWGTFIRGFLGGVTIGYTTTDGDNYGSITLASNGLSTEKILYANGGLLISGKSAATQEYVNSAVSGATVSGGFLKAPEVVSSGGSVAVIPVLSGGRVYRFDQELTTLSIGGVADTPLEDTILFSAGGVVTPPASMTAYFESAFWDDEIWESAVGSKAISLVSSGGSYVYAPAGEYWAGGEDEGAKVWLSGGSFVGVSSGGTITVSAHNVQAFHQCEYYDYEIDDTRISGGSSVLNGLVASSTNGGSGWTFGGVAIPGYYDNMGEWRMASGSACKVECSQTLTPCAVMLPSGAELVGSSKIELESGHHYEMNVANGGIVTAERFAQEVSE